MNSQVNLTDLEYSKLESFVTETLGQPKFRAKQISAGFTAVRLRMAAFAWVRSRSRT